MQIPVISHVSEFVQTKEGFHQQVLVLAEQFFQLFATPKKVLAVLPMAFAVLAGHKGTLGC